VRSAWPWAGTWLLGLATSKTLKHLLTRERPSSLPDVAVGYSFPSAHVMNGLLAMCAVMALAHGFRHRRRWYLSAGVLTATLAIGRILLAHHWASDVLGGVASALALVGFAAPALARRPVLAPTLLATLLAVVFVLDRSVGKGGWHLPTPLVGRRTALVDIDVGPETGPALRGAWTAAGPEPPFDSFQWLDGEGSVAFDVADDAVGSATTLRVAFAGRPQKRPRSCATLDVVLNGQRLARFVPFVGWREYRLPLPRALVHVGRNELAISAADETGPARFGLTYVRLAPSAAE
jgi:hypothetical protein